jgi:23S rRNA (cytosine1962-C5)-methyltransferase
MSKQVVLKFGKDKAIRNRHHWIFSGAVQQLPPISDGEILPVLSNHNEVLGHAYFNKRSGIVGRMVSFGDQDPLKFLEARLDQAIDLRKSLLDTTKTTGYRLVNGEGDGIPGLIVDLYGEVLVIQVGTCGIERLKPWIIDQLVKKVHPKIIYEKSSLPARREEGLKDDQEALLYGDCVDEVIFKENGYTFATSLAKSQKTGFFLDHREMRQWVSEISAGKHVLNAFSYSGGFSVYALAGGALTVDSVDISADAIAAAKQNVLLNGFKVDDSQFICGDVFQYLREHDLQKYQLVILDPPAFAKRQKDVVAACRGYKDINRLAMQKMPPKSILVTCSCSYHVDETLFRQVLFQAAGEAKRNVKIVGRHRMAADHPINIFHPESDYLKSFVLYID